jgi:glutamine---fructose-6-phosphate transaminase (isomerizing)
MCGIFGFSYQDNNEERQISYLENDIKLFTKINRIRGSDTFGASVSNEKESFIYKINTDPNKAIKRKDYKNFLRNSIQSINQQNKSFLTIIGQTRLVTNGTKFLYANNQPIITANLIGVHNGIIVNTDHELTSKTANLEGYNVKSDSLEFYENLDKILNQNKNFLKEYLNYIKAVIGNYSIAFRPIESSKIVLSSNCGALYYYYDDKRKFIVFSSEKSFLVNYLNKSKVFKNNSLKKNNIHKILNQTIVYDEKEKIIYKIEHNSQKINNFNPNEYFISKNINSSIIDNFSTDKKNHENLQKCTNCILPETYPFISFDSKGICNFCNNYKKQEFKGEEELLKVLDKFRSNNNHPDCLVGLSGGRDSSYGLHLLKEKFKMNPVAYTYDWGLTTDTSRINQSKICGKLGIEHIIRSANISKKRSYVRENIMAWLKKPHLGMLPIIQAGDKGFIDYGRILSKELDLKLVIHFTGYQLEQREFFLGFAGVSQLLKNNQRMVSYSTFNKLKMFSFYSSQFLFNPHYINSALLDNFNGFLASFVRKENFMHFYNYINWDEEEIKKVLKEVYDWESDISYGKNQWRMGDGQTAFNNFIYYTVAGFSEYDNFRSNQIREGIISREEAVKLAAEDNKFKYNTLKNFSEIIGFNLEDVLSQIQCIPKLF